MPRLSQHSPEKMRAMLLKAGETIVVEEGASALTARRVAFEIGHTVTSVYKTFANMGDLIRQLNQQTAKRLQNQLDQCLAEDAEAVTILTRLALTHWRFARQQSNLWRLMFTYSAERTPPDYGLAIAGIDQPFIEAGQRFFSAHDAHLGLALSRAVNGILLGHYLSQPCSLDEETALILLESICQRFAGCR